MGVLPAEIYDCDSIHETSKNNKKAVTQSGLNQKTSNLFHRKLYTYYLMENVERDEIR